MSPLLVLDQTLSQTVPTKGQGVGVGGGFSGGSDSKESACNAGDLGLIPGWDDPLEVGMATHSSIVSGRISMDRGAWWAIVHGVSKKSDMTKHSIAPTKEEFQFWLFWVEKLM